MRVIPKQENALTYASYRKISLGDLFSGGHAQDNGWIPNATYYPLTVVHQDDDGYLILLLDVNDASSTVIAQTIDFDFID